MVGATTSSIRRATTGRSWTTARSSSRRRESSRRDGSRGLEKSERALGELRAKASPTELVGEVGRRHRSLVGDRRRRARCVSPRGLAGFRRRAHPPRTQSLSRSGVEPLELDVTDPVQIAAAAEAVGEELDGLVDNAGIAIAAPLELVPLDELRRQLEVNVIGQVAVTQAFLPALRRARAGSCSWARSADGAHFPFLGPYAASKHALEAIADVAPRRASPVGHRRGDHRAGERQDGDLDEGRGDADEMRAGLPSESAELYAERIARFRQVAL